MITVEVCQDGSSKDRPYSPILATDPPAGKLIEMDRQTGLCRYRFETPEAVGALVEWLDDLQQQGCAGQRLRICVSAQGPQGRVQRTIVLEQKSRHTRFHRFLELQREASRLASHRDVGMFADELLQCGSD